MDLLRHLGLSALRLTTSLVLLIGFWAMVARFGRLPQFILPQPSSVLTVIIREHRLFFESTIYTVQNALIGASIGIAAGFCTGLLAAGSRVLRWIIEPYLLLFQSFPREALIPLFAVWLGFGQTPKVISSSLLCFFPMAILTASVLLDTRWEYIELLQSWGASSFQQLIYCRFPAAVPAMVGGIGKVCLPLSLIGAVLGEMTGGGNKGLGYIIITAGSVSRVDRIFGAIAILGALGVAILGVVATAQVSLRKFNQD